MTRFCLLIVTVFVLNPEISTVACAQERQASDSTIALPTQWGTYYVVMLKEGPSYADELSADSLSALMNSHIQYQLRLQETEQALVAGGFGDATDGVIGMTLLRAGSAEEAERLAQADPAVSAGRLRAVVYEWYVPAGRLPE